MYSVYTSPSECSSENVENGLETYEITSPASRMTTIATAMSVQSRALMLFHPPSVEHVDEIQHHPDYDYLDGPA